MKVFYCFIEFYIILKNLSEISGNNWFPKVRVRKGNFDDVENHAEIKPQMSFTNESRMF